MTSYATADAATRLLAIREAIDQVLSTQMYTRRGFTNQKARLDHLRAIEKELQSEVQELALNGGSMASLGQVDRVR